jgi:hypothetical protein
VAELLDAMALPSALDRAVLARAVQEMSDEIQPSGPGDWAAFTAYARRLTRERVEDYVASLAGGPLVPVGSEAVR